MSTSFLTYLICFVAFILLLMAEFYAKARKSRTLYDILSSSHEISILNHKLICGIIITGSAAVYWFLSTGNINFLAFKVNDWALLFILASTAAMFIGYASAKKIFPANSSSAHVPSLYFTATYLLLRALFLIAYEIFFRGVLLFSILIEVGEMNAIAVNVLLYMLLHSFSNRKELIGTIPFGLLLCVMTLLYQSIWPAVIIHLCLALGHEITLLNNHRSSIKTVPL